MPEKAEHVCLVCGSPEITIFLELSRVPVYCNLLWETADDAIAAPRGNIRLGLCESCGHICNVCFDPARMSYGSAYENSLHFSPRFQDYARNLARRLVERYTLWHKTIIEIGCGTGEFLSLLCDLGGNRGLGFDPRYDGQGEAKPHGRNVTFIGDVFSEKYAGYQADFYCSRHVLEHIHDPRMFLQQVRRAIGNNRQSVLFLEVPNVLYTLRQLGIWDVIYEHCSYFSTPSLTRLLLESDFIARDAYEAYGNQFLCIEAVGGPDTPETVHVPDSRLGELKSLVNGFASAYKAKVERWKDHLQALREMGSRIALWGAGSKGVTFLNTVSGADGIDHVVDINPRKQGMYVAGTGQRIVTPESLLERRPDTILAMNPIYQDEIAQRLATIGLTPQILSV